jgi:magnesium-transporting ATPase (P-type)
MVGFMGDGINDAGALRESGCRISADSAGWLDIAKESVHINSPRESPWVFG